MLAAHSSHLQSRLYRQEEKDKARTGSTTVVGGFDDDSTLGPIIELQDSQACSKGLVGETADFKSLV